MIHARIRRLFRLRKLCVLAGLCVIATATNLAAAEPSVAGGFVDRVYKDAEGEHKYVIFVPKGYTSDRAWPVILWLHGASARGRDGRAPLVAGLPPNVHQRRESLPFLVVFPQCENLDSRLLGGWTDEPHEADRALRILKDAESHYRVDSRRRVLAGVSMGAFGVWSVGARTADMWSALIAVSGGGPQSIVEPLSNIPVWAFHAADDQVVPPSASSVLVDAVNAKGGRAYYTELPNGGHNIGSRVFANDEIYAWLLDPKAEPQFPQAWPLSANTERTLQDEVKFVPGGEMDRAIHVRIGADVLAALATGLPGQIPAESLQGARGPQSQRTSAGWSSFQVTVSGVQYAGRVDRAQVKPLGDNRLQVRIGLRPLTMTIPRTQIEGRLLRAQAGAMQIVIGAKRPAWLDIIVHPTVSERKIKLELVSAAFSIERDNWYVTEPNGVDVFPLPMLGNRISQRLTEGMYAKQAEFEQQVVAGVPQMLAQIERQAASRLDRVVTFGRWPMPVWQPRAKFWPSSIAVDEQGLSIQLGTTLGALARRTNRVELKQFAAPQGSPPARDFGVQIGIANDVVEAWTTLLAASDVRRFHVQDFHAEAFQRLGDRTFLAQALPGCIDPKSTHQLRSVMSFEQPLRIEAAAAPLVTRTASASRLSPISTTGLRLIGQELRLTISERADATSAWTPLAEFPIAFHQDFRVTTWKAGHLGRRLSMESLAPPAVEATGRSLSGTGCEARPELVADQFRLGWEATFATELQKMMQLPERVIANVPLVSDGITQTGEHLTLRMSLPTTQIQNLSNSELVYEMRAGDSEWSSPLKLAPRMMHEYPVSSPILWRWKSSDQEYRYTLPIGSVSRFAGGEQPLRLQPSP